MTIYRGTFQISGIDESFWFGPPTKCLMCGAPARGARRCARHIDAYRIWQMGGADEVTFKGKEDDVPLACEQKPFRVHVA